MKIPYVIDNQQHKLADVLNELLTGHYGKSLDIATAYFTVGGFELIKPGLQGLGNFRLLLGAEPASGEQLGLRVKDDAVKGLIRRDLEALSFDEKMLRTVEDLIAFLTKDRTAVRRYSEGFLHAKCYLFYNDKPTSGWDRFQPVAGIVGSSNFTIPGLTSNRELNLSHKTVLTDDEAVDSPLTPSSTLFPSDSNLTLDHVEKQRQIKSEVGARAILELDRWYEERWKESRDFKAELIELLDASKFGRKEYTPFDVYMKALYEYFKDDLDEDAIPGTRSAIELAEFQEDAVKKARRILSRYDGVMIADSVGLGKTWIGKKLLEDFAYHMRQKALVICPASLREMWEKELKEVSIAATILSQEELGREEFDAMPYGDADILLIDESHNFRNRNAQRYLNLSTIIGLNSGRGKSDARKKVILLTATPINNDLFDLYNQIMLITQGDLSYFSACGIGDLRRYILKARRDNQGKNALAIFNLLEEVVIRRTRPFIRQAYPEATIRGKKISFPERKLKTVRYDLEKTYEGIYEAVVSGVEKLSLPPYSLETYKKKDRDEEEVQREQALVGIFKSRYLKRFESSVEAFRISVRRALEFLKTFETYILGGRLMLSSDFQKAMQYLERENEEDDAVPTTLATEFDASEEAKRVLDGMATVDTKDYDLKKLHTAVEHDVAILTKIWNKVKDIGPDQDNKLQELKKKLQGELSGQKVLIFSYFKDTVRYLYKNLGSPDNPAAVDFCGELGGLHVRRLDSGNHPKERAGIVQAFAPKANDKAELVGTEKEIDVLISTDVLSEGQNLQDCGYLVNYDLHWNPTRMVQRAGRIDRIGTDFKELWIYNMFPDAGLEKLLGLVESLSAKIASIDNYGFLDASVLGEIVHPRNFNTLRRIEEEDGSVIVEEEQFTNLASNEGLLKQLKTMLDLGGRDVLETLPDGIHSGLVKEKAKGVFFYFQAVDESGEKDHFWRYVDLTNDSISDNRYLIANLISCEKDTARVVDQDLFKSVFDLQNRVIDEIAGSVQARQAIQLAPRTVDPLQQTVATIVQSAINRPDVERGKAIAVIKFLNQPMLVVQIKELRAIHKDYQQSGDVVLLIQSLERLMSKYQIKVNDKSAIATTLRQKFDPNKLRLICFDFLSGA